MKAMAAGQLVHCAGACTPALRAIQGRVEQLVGAYSAALLPSDCENLCTTIMAAAHLTASELMEPALMSDNPLAGLAYAEALLERAADADQQAYAYLRIAQHASALYDYDRAQRALECIADDRTSERSENRTLEKNIELVSLQRERGDYQAAYRLIQAVLTQSIQHPGNRPLRAALISLAAKCAARAGDAEATRRFLLDAARVEVDRRFMDKSIEAAQNALDNFDDYMAAARRACAEHEKRKAFYRDLSRTGSFADIVRGREAALQRPLTAVERVQLNNRIRSVNPRLNH